MTPFPNCVVVFEEFPTKCAPMFVFNFVSVGGAVVKRTPLPASRGVLLFNPNDQRCPDMSIPWSFCASRVPRFRV